MRSFVGLNGSVSVGESGISLTRESKLDGVFHELGTAVIPYEQIVKVVYAEGGLSNGYMAFLRKGDKRPHSVFSALKNDSAIIFRFTKNESAKEIVDLVKERI